ncbi:hypothetical protein F5Y01DRAFT_319603 [Xylaria sp. FL0043]|nr:hypothetical protein F5Y01DRAFT_319603 [Xylaria sp. FL0043]
MYFVSVIATLLLGAALSAPTIDPTRIYFTCDSSKASGFSPSCCTDINGQVGINCKIPDFIYSFTSKSAPPHAQYFKWEECIGAHIEGVTNPMYSCNLYVYNITGCCQTIGYKNPYTNNSLGLCAMSIDPI